MKFAAPTLMNHYQSCIDAVSEGRPRSNDGVISLRDVIDAHFFIVDYFLETPQGAESIRRIGPRDPQRLTAIVDRQLSVSSRNIEAVRDYETCAELFYGLIKDRPFYDCNRRTALLTALYFLAKRKRAPTASHKELEIITRIIASNTIRDRTAFTPYTKFDDGEIRFLARYLQENNRPIDRRSYSITCLQLNDMLKNVDVCLDNPHGDSIDIIRIETRDALFGFRKAKRRSKIGTIAFRGWTRAVSEEDMLRLRAATGLSPIDGLDASRFCNEAPPLPSLINQYGDIFIELQKHD